MTSIFVKFQFCQVNDIDNLIEKFTSCYKHLKYKQFMLKDEFITIHFESAYKENYSSVYYKFKTVLKGDRVHNFSLDILECN